MAELHNVEGEFDEIIRLDGRRRDVGEPSREQIDFIKKNFIPMVRSRFIGGLGERSRILDDLSQYRLDAQRIMGRSLSRPLLCASFSLDDVGEQCMDAARGADSENDIEKFRFFFDFAIGSRLVLKSISQAENELHDSGEDMRLKVASYTGSVLNRSTSEVAEKYLFMRKESADFLDFLRRDPSGFLLLSSLVEKVEAGSDLRIKHCTKEYVLGGAEISRDLYKELYGIAAPLYPQGQSKQI